MANRTMLTTEDAVAKLARKLELNARQELALYLVVTRRKPAAILRIDGLLERRETQNWIKNLIEERTEIRMMRRLGLSVSRGENVDGTGRSRMSYEVAVDSGALKRLRAARSNRSIGLALGFPKEEVNLYTSGKESEASYKRMLAQAVQAQVSIPEFLPYLFYVPVSLDVMNNSAAAMTIFDGTTTMQFVRKRNSRLANRAEMEHVAELKGLLAV